METLYLLRSVTSDFLGGPVGTRVWSLLWELRSCMPKRKNYNFSYRWGVKTHNLKSYFKKRKGAGNFPGGPVDKNPPANAGNTGLIPGLRGFCMPHKAAGPCSTTTEPAFKSPTLQLLSPGAATIKAQVPRACALQLEKAHTQQQRLGTTKINMQGLTWWSVARTPHSQCRGAGFDPRSGN